MKHNRFRPVALLLCLIAGLWFFSGPILRAAGSVLEKDGPPAKADMIVVLAGDGLGFRILKGAELAREGYAPAVLISNGGFSYLHTESDLAKEFAVQKGYSPNLLISTNWESTSTVDEGERAIAELRRRGAHKAIIVTTVWHTARAGRIYRRLAPDLQFYMVGSYDPHWRNGDWWITREGRKTFFLEGTKTIADFFRI